MNKINKFVGAALAFALLAPTAAEAVSTNTSFTTAITANAAEAVLHEADRALIETGNQNLVDKNNAWKLFGIGRRFRADNKVYSGKKVVVYYRNFGVVHCANPNLFNRKNVFVILVDGRAYVQFNVQKAAFILK